MDIRKEDVNFGDYCSIEQKRYGAPNEFYGYKVVNRLRSNTWISVPVDAQNCKPKCHDEVVDVVEVISCTAGCDMVERFRVADLARVWQAAKDQAVPEEKGRSDFEIITQTIELVDLIAGSNRFQRDKSKPFPFESNNPRNIEWWRLACKIQELLTDTDPENCDFDEYKAMIEAQEPAND